MLFSALCSSLTTKIGISEQSICASTEYFHPHGTLFLDSNLFRVFRSLVLELPVDGELTRRIMTCKKNRWWEHTT